MSIGKSIPHESSHLHAQGHSLFVDDQLEHPNEVFVDYVESPVAHGELISIDISIAKKDPDYIACFAAKDIPGKNILPVGLQEQPLLVEKIIEFLGEPILIIVSSKRESLLRIRKKVKLEIKELTPILSLDAAIDAKKYIGDTKIFDSKSIKEGFLKSEHIIEGILESGSQEHFYLESQASIAYPDEKNHINILSSTQHPTENQHAVAKILGIPYSQVICRVQRLGGGFGGKESQATPFAAFAALAAWKLKVPARISLSCERDMRFTGKRHAYKNFYKVGFNKQGLLQALQVYFYSNGGAYSDLSLPILDRTLFHSDNAYYIPHYYLQGQICKTNLPPATAFRGFGGPQGMLNIENIMEEIALFLKKDAAEIRLLNLYNGKRNKTPYGQKINDGILPDLFKKILKSSQYKKRSSALTITPSVLRGIAVTPLKFGISFTAKFLNQASSLVNVHLDGSIQVSTAAIEMGQGVYTKIQQVVSESFGVSSEAVEVMTTSTEKNPNTSATAASSGTDLNGCAALVACEKIKNRLNAFLLKKIFKVPTPLSLRIQNEEIKYKNNFITYKKFKIKLKEALDLAYLERISLTEQGFYATPNLSFDPITRRGNAFLYYTQGASVTEVAINRWTGALQIIRNDLLVDIGQPINPSIDLGQIKGGFIQGMGWLTNEEIIYDNTGSLLSHSPTTYKVPHIEDLPQEWKIELYKNLVHDKNIYNSKAVGEPPFMLAISVWCAIKNALQNYKDVHTLKAPATSEEILRILTKG